MRDSIGPSGGTPMQTAVILLMAMLQAAPAPAPAKRPMTFVDVVSMRTVGDMSVSPDGQYMLYTLSTPDWQDGKSYTDIHLVPLDRGVSASRQMTATRGKNESSPRWSRDSKFFMFLSNREAPASAQSQNQLYLMRPDGGEDVRLTEVQDGEGILAV